MPTVSGSPYANGYVLFNLGAYNYYTPYPVYTYGTGYNYGYNYGYTYSAAPSYWYGR